MHRDIKPDNILLNDANDPIICDFSLAKVVYPTSVLAAAAAAPKAGGKKKKAKKEKRKPAGVEGTRNSEGAGVVGFGVDFDRFLQRCLRDVTGPPTLVPSCLRSR